MHNKPKATSLSKKRTPIKGIYFSSEKEEGKQKSWLLGLFITTALLTTGHSEETFEDSFAGPGEVSKALPWGDLSSGIVNVPESTPHGLPTGLPENEHGNLPPPNAELRDAPKVFPGNDEPLSLSIPLETTELSSLITSAEDSSIPQHLPSKKEKYRDALFQLKHVEGDSLKGLGILEALGDAGYGLAQSSYIDYSAEIVKNPLFKQHEALENIKKTRDRFYITSTKDLEAIIEKNPDADKQRYRLAKTHLNYGRVDAAREILQQLLERNYSKAQYLVAKNPDLHPALNDEDRQALFFEAASHKTLPYSKAWEALGATAYEKGQYGDAKMYFEMAYASTEGKNYGALGLGRLYYNGLGVPKDFHKAFELFNVAAQKGDRIALTLIGRMWQTGVGTEENLEKAALYYKKSSSMGDSYAQALLSEMYLHGWGVKKNAGEGMDYLKAALTAKEPYGFFVYGDLLYRTFKKNTAEEGAQESITEISASSAKRQRTQNKKTINEAIFYLNKASEKGESKAHALLGIIYEELGKLSEAKKYYEKGVQEGNVEAMMNLGRLYQTDGFAEANETEALKLFTNAGKMGDMDGSFMAGKIHLKNKDYLEAEEFFNQVVAKEPLGSPLQAEAHFNLGILYGAERWILHTDLGMEDPLWGGLTRTYKPDLAFFHFDKSAAMGNIEAGVEFSKLYFDFYDAKSVEDDSNALNKLETAAEAKNLEAIKILKKINEGKISVKPATRSRVNSFLKTRIGPQGVRKGIINSLRIGKVLSQ